MTSSVIGCRYDRQNAIIETVFADLIDGPLTLPVKLGGIKRDEVRTLPIAFEDRLEFGEDVGVACGRGPDIPL